MMTKKHSIIINCSLIILIVSFLLSNTTIHAATDDKYKKGGVLTMTKIKKHQLESNTVYYINKKIDLRGIKLIMPENCKLVFVKGYILNGEVTFHNTYLDGSVDLRCRAIGTICNDTIKTGWFGYEDHVLYDIFALSENKVVIFEEQSEYSVDYSFLIPSCEIIGNNSSIVLKNTDECSLYGKVVKIRNKHYDGGGRDSFKMKGLCFVTSIDDVYLFSMQNTDNCTISDCGFICCGEGRRCSHALDMRGFNTNTTIERCKIINKSDAIGGGGLWIRAFGDICNVIVDHCYFFNTCTDEVLAFNAVTSDIYNVTIKDCEFYYQKGLTCPEPHVMWGLTQDKGKIDNVCFLNCSVKSDFLPSFVLNLGVATNIKVVHCSFDFEDASFNTCGLNTTFFNGKMTLEESLITILAIKKNNKKSTITLFGSDVIVKKSKIINNCEGVFLGGAQVFNTEVDFNNSQLFNGRIPTVMSGCTIHLGKNTPKLAANPYSQKEKCLWMNNIINSDVPVTFHFVYNNDYLEYTKNTVHNVTITGFPFKQ